MKERSPRKSAGAGKKDIGFVLRSSAAKPYRRGRSLRHADGEEECIRLLAGEGGESGQKP
jgi:hypothetical protein